MIDHIGINVSNFERSKNFYTAALSPLGYKLVQEYDAAETGFKNAAGFGVDGIADFWIVDEQVNNPPVHVAFTADSSEKVNTFYEAALRMGGKDNGMPSVRRHYYYPNYYGALVLDPDGHNIEVVCYDSPI